MLAYNIDAQLLNETHMTKVAISSANNAILATFELFSISRVTGEGELWIVGSKSCQRVFFDKLSCLRMEGKRSNHLEGKANFTAGARGHLDLLSHNWFRKLDLLWLEKYCLDSLFVMSGSGEGSFASCAVLQSDKSSAACPSALI